MICHVLSISMTKFSPFLGRNKEREKGDREGRTGRRGEKRNCNWDIKLINLFIKEKQNVGEEKTY